MDFLEHLDLEFTYSKEAFLYTINRLPDSKIVVINIGINSLSYNTGLLNIRSFKNFIADVSEFVNENSKRRVIIVISDSLEKTRHLYSQDQYTLSTNSGLYSSLVALTHNDIATLFSDGFANYNLRAIGLPITSASADASGELSKMLKTIEGIIYSNSKEDEVKIRAVKELLNNKNIITQTSRYNVITKRTSKMLKGLFKYFPRTIPIIMEDISQKDNESEEDDGFAAKIAMAVSADVVVSISRKGMLYTVDPIRNDNALPFYCFDTSRKMPFNDSRRAVLSKKLNAAAHVNAYSRPIPLILTSYNKPYTICDMFNKKAIEDISRKGEFPKFTLFINSRKILKFSTDTSLPIENRHISGAVIIDDNAEKALIRNKKSLLSVGIVKTHGDFESKSVVAILNINKDEIGIGVVNYDSISIRKIIEEGNTTEIISRTKMRLKKSNMNET